VGINTGNCEQWGNKYGTIHVSKETPRGEDVLEEEETKGLEATLQVATLEIGSWG